MTRLHVLVFVAALVGCQAGPPANDPFMRPRVPPPVTGDITPIQPGVAAAPGGQPMAPVVTMPGTNYAPPAGNYNYSGAGSIYANPPAGSRGYTMPAGQTPAYTAPPTPQYTTPPAGANPSPAQPGSSIYNRQSSWNRSADASASGRAGSRTITTSRIVADRGAASTGAGETEEMADGAMIDESRVVRASRISDADDPADQTVVRPRRSTRGRGPADRGETYGFDPNYAWLHGRLEHSQVDGQWKLRYIALDGQTDRYGGSVVLSEDSPVAGHQPGEFVSVAGAIESPADKQDGFAPIYRAARIERLSL
jgi:hypothetical protein